MTCNIFINLDQKFPLFSQFEIRKICLLTEGLQNQAVKPLSMEHYKEKYSMWIMRGIGTTRWYEKLLIYFHTNSLIIFLQCVSEQRTVQVPMKIKGQVRQIKRKPEHQNRKWRKSHLVMLYCLVQPAWQHCVLIARG